MAIYGHGFAAVLVGAVWLGSASGQTKYKLELAEQQTVTGTLTYSAKFADLQAKEWIAFAAVAPELPGQKNPKTVFDFPGAEKVKDKSPLARSALLAKVPAKTDDLKTKLSMKVSYTATLFHRHLVEAGDGPVAEVKPLTAQEVREALTEHGDIDFKEAGFQKWWKAAGYTKGEDEAEIPFARRVFLGLRASHTYDFKAGMDRKASAVCEGGKSDCGGLSHLFTAVMRANGVPARTLYGRWAKSAKADEKLGDALYFQWHVKAEFFAPGVGWVPVDLSVSILHDKSKEGLAYFGHDAGDFLTLHIDPNFQLDTGAFGKQAIHNLQEPAFWVTGSGKMDKRIDKEGWTVEVKK